MTVIRPLDSLDSRRFETAPILRKLASASRQLAELKGVAGSIPNQAVLINTLGLREAKDSSAIENIVTTHDELFQEDVYPAVTGSAAAKEVQRYRQALRVGFERVRTTGLLTLNHILEVQAGARTEQRRVSSITRHRTEESRHGRNRLRSAAGSDRSGD